MTSRLHFGTHSLEYLLGSNSQKSKVELRANKFCLTRQCVYDLEYMLTNIYTEFEKWEKIEYLFIKNDKITVNQPYKFN